MGGTEMHAGGRDVDTVMARPPRVPILGTGVHALNMRSAVSFLDGCVRSRSRGYVCVTGVHGIIEAVDDESFRTILNSSLLTTPDGMPTVWMGWLRGYREMGRVYGPDLMLELCELSARRGYTHFLYGGREGVAGRLRDELQRRFPGLRVVGTYTPPFRPLNDAERSQLAAEVAALRPDFLWVGLSTPKQERFMAEYAPLLDATVLLGVGAAFDIHIGDVKDSPGWIKRSGLQWLHRLVQEPRRLWRRYLINNPRFVALLTLEALGIRRRRAAPPD